MEEKDKDYELIFNDLTDKPIFAGFYLMDIIIAVCLGLFCFSLVFGLNILEPSSFSIVGLYLLLFFKDPNKNSIAKKLANEFNYWVLEKKIYFKGDEYEKK